MAFATLACLTQLRSLSLGHPGGPTASAMWSQSCGFLVTPGRHATHLAVLSSLTCLTALQLHPPGSRMRYTLMYDTAAAAVHRWAQGAIISVPGTQKCLTLRHVQTLRFRLCVMWILSPAMRRQSLSRRDLLLKGLASKRHPCATWLRMTCDDAHALTLIVPTVLIALRLQLHSLVRLDLGRHSRLTLPYMLQVGEKAHVQAFLTGSVDESAVW